LAQHARIIVTEKTRRTKYYIMQAAQ